MSNEFEMTDEEDSAGTTVTLKFVVVSEGAVVAPDTTPKLSNPSSSYGVAVVEGGAIVTADATNMVADGAGWKYTFSHPVGADDHTAYRYYVEAVVDGITFHLPRTTSFAKSACLVFGRYCNSFEIEQEFGVDNLHKWLGIDSHDEAVDYALRLYAFIKSAEAEVDDALRDGGSSVPFEDGTPELVRRVATLMAGVRAYESRGVDDVDQATGNAMHRLRFQSSWTNKQLKAIRGGILRLTTDDATRFPEAVNECLSDRTTDRTYS